jgi:hypothetical protein
MVDAIKHVRIVRKSNDLPNPPNGGYLDDLDGNRVGRIRRLVIEILQLCNVATTSALTREGRYGSPRSSGSPEHELSSDNVQEQSQDDFRSRTQICISRFVRFRAVNFAARSGAGSAGFLPAGAVTST